eukprot:g10993.t1
MKNGWQRDEQYKDFIPDQEDIEDTIVKQGFTIYPKGNPITNTYAWARNDGHFFVYDTKNARTYKCPVHGYELGTPELRILFNSGPKTLNQMLLEPEKARRKKPKRFLSNNCSPSPKKKRSKNKKCEAVVSHYTTVEDVAQELQQSEKIRKDFVRENEKRKKDQTKIIKRLVRQTKQNDRDRDAQFDKLTRKVEKCIKKIKDENHQSIKKLEDKIMKTRMRNEKKINDLVAYLKGMITERANQTKLAAEATVDTIEDASRRIESDIKIQARASINFENSTKAIFTNILYRSINKALSSGMVATNEMNALSGVPRTMRCKKVYFNSFDSSNTIKTLFEQILPSGNYYMKDMPKDVRVDELVYKESENGEMVICGENEKKKTIQDCAPGTVRVSVDESELISLKYDIVNSQIYKHLQVVINLIFYRRVQIPERYGNGWRDM